MAHSHKKSRRGFLKLSAKLAALGVTTLGVELGKPRGVFAAEAATTAGLTDYKALVCIYLFGGNDGNNMIVPVDAARNQAYMSLRGDLGLAGNELLPPIADAQGNPYALHYGMPELNAIYGAGQLAFVLNTGQLDAPLTRAEYLQGLKTPTNLFSHSDQTVQAQTGVSTPNGSGWGGRLLDCCGVTDPLAAVSLSSPALFLQGFSIGGNVIPPGGGLSLAGMSFWPPSQAAARKAAVTQLLTIDGGSLMRNTANKAMADGLQLADTLAAANASYDGQNLVFPGSSLGNQLKEVAKLIKARSALGPGRQVFFCSMDGFDLHSSQDWTHWSLLSQLSPALAAFHKTMQDASLTNNVTAFTQSEFGRTLQPSGTGSDHAWGSHQIVVGGAVKGGVYGTLPTLALSGPDDAGNRGVWIPKISTAQFGGTLGKWFGATPQDLLWAFPTLVNFPASDIGFMNP
jgi:uncharacterized protein (DUF1501 family)